MKNSLPHGANMLLEGFKLLREPRLRRFVVVPLLLNIVLFSVMMFIAGHYFSEMTTWLLAKLPSWLQWLSWLLWIIFAFGFVFIAGFCFTSVATLLGAPFNAMLSEQVELLLTDTLPESASATMLATFKDVPRTMKRQLAIIGYFIPRAVVLLILFLIPVVSLIASPCWFVFSSWSLALQYMDYPMDNHKVAFADMREQLTSVRYTTLGFGLLGLALTLVPVLNFFVMPAAVAGATKFAVELREA